VKIESLSESEIDALEIEAGKGRDLFHAGKYHEAAAVFEKISQHFTVSKPLYLNELACCYLAEGDIDRAKRTFREAHTLMEVLDPQSEAKALSLFGSESQKFYRGDPYERAMNCLLLGVLFLRDHDVDNALACFNSGILCDSEVPNDEFKSDFFLLYALAGKCYLLRKQPDMAQKYFDCARQALAATDMNVRQLQLSRQLLARARENNRVFQEQLVIDFMITCLDRKIEMAKAAVNIDSVKMLLDGDYNVLVLLLQGKSLKKGRVGMFGEMVEVYEPLRDDTLRFELRVDGGIPVDPLRDLCDVNYQGLTRGGRLMDRVLQKKASFKRNANTVSEGLIVGGGMIVTGVIVKGVAYYTVARCDVRCWQTLPGEIRIMPLRLPSGRHVIEVDSFRTYFRERPTRKFNLDIVPESGVDVIVSYP